MSTQDVISLVGVVIGVIAAIIAGWQAMEARKARTASAKIAADAQAKLADIEEGRVAQKRRKIDIEWQRGGTFAVTNRTGETVTDVTVEGAGDRPARIFQGGSWDRLADQDSATYIGESGEVLASWTDGREQRQSRTLHTRRGDK